MVVCLGTVWGCISYGAIPGFYINTTKQVESGVVLKDDNTFYLTHKGSSGVTKIQFSGTYKADSERVILTGEKLYISSGSIANDLTQTFNITDENLVAVGKGQTIFQEGVRFLRSEDRPDLDKLIEKELAKIADEKETFKTEKEAVEHYRLKLAKTEFTTFSEAYALFDVRKDGDEAKEAFLSLDPVLKLFKSKAGKLLNVDVCMAPKLGNTIQRAGYIFAYQHNVAFADAWFANTETGWRLINISFIFNTNTEETLKSIPSEYFSG